MAQSPKVAAPTFDVGAAGPGPYRIQVAAELSGMPAATLRAWERRYGVPVPRRTTSAYRLYTAEDVALIRRMNDLVLSGMAPSDAARAVLATAPSPHADRLALEPDADPLGLARQRILAATERWDGDAIDAELTRLSYLVDAQSLFSRIVAPVLSEVGERWEAGELSIAQEHLLSEKVELALRAALRTLERRDGPLAVVGCVDGETHVLGLLGAAIRLATSGWRVVVLGASTPPVAVGDVTRSMAPRLVGLSVTRPPPSPRPLFKAYAKEIGSTPWVVGGAATNDVEAAVRAAGGAIAAESGPAWNQQVRDWLRGGS